MLFHSPLVNRVLFTISRNYTADFAGHSTPRKIFIIHHDLGHFIHMDHCMRFECPFSVRPVTFHTNSDFSTELLITCLEQIPIHAQYVPMG